MIAYTLKVSQPEARRAEIALECETRGEASLDVRLPVWTPGSYLIREHQRHVDGLSASDESGRALAVEKIDKHTWRISCAGSRRVRVSYRLGCFELTVRTNHVDPTHAFLNPAAACAYFVGREGQPCTVKTELPAGWRTWVALPWREGAFHAGDYDELADSPFEMGPDSSHSAHSFTVQGVQHELVVWGRGDFDARRAIPDMTRIVEALAAIYGELPFRDRYLFLLHLNDKGRGGLEHRRSCALLVPRFVFVQKAAYEDFLQLVAHEYFHLWNVKRIRPQAFTPYDWTRENYTRLLWAMEGLTSFYEVVALRRAGLVSPERFVAIWGERITQLWRTPGRARTPLALASFDSWIKHYRPDESTANTTVSYYLKGSVVGFLLDLEIRRRTSGSRSLDDVMRLLFERHGRGQGLPEDGVEKAATEISGEDLRPWFDRAIRGTEELDVEGALAGVGLSAVFRASTGPEDKGGAAARLPEPPDTAPRAYLGAAFRDKGQSLEVAGVMEGSPAQEAGLAAGDEIVALDGFRSEMQRRLSRGPPGQEVRLSVFRLDELVELTARLAAAPRDTATVVPSAHAEASAIELRTGWLGAPWPDSAG
ncbi:MAG: M61 family metallopeptidase [Myxococcales bacterium]